MELSPDHNTDSPSPKFEADPPTRDPELSRFIDDQAGAFDDQLAKLSDLFRRYSDSPIEIAEDAPDQVKEQRRQAQEHPVKLLYSLLASREIIAELQKPYDDALRTLAEANGVSTTEVPLDQMARAIETASINREHPGIKAHLENGGKVAAIVLGIGGTGKGTMIERSDYDRAVNHTSRAMRPGEAEGRDYYYRPDIDMDTPLAEVESALGTELLADLVRPGRGRYMTSKKAVEEALQNNSVVFIEQAPDKIGPMVERAREIMPNLLIVPVCILPPDRGVIELAARVVARSYGDENHRDPEGPEGVYKLKDSYLTSTIGPEQIAEITQTAAFLTDQSVGSVAYIVNDDLRRAIDVLNNLFKA